MKFSFHVRRVMIDYALGFKLDKQTDVSAKLDLNGMIK